MCPLYEGSKIARIIFLGGNEQKRNYVFDLESATWTKCGTLPLFHIVTEQMNISFGQQAITIYTQVNFQTNKFELCMATNNGSLEDRTWEWLF